MGVNHQNQNHQCCLAEEAVPRKDSLLAEEAVPRKNPQRSEEAVPQKNPQRGKEAVHFLYRIQAEVGADHFQRAVLGR